MTKVGKDAGRDRNRARAGWAGRGTGTGRGQVGRDGRCASGQGTDAGSWSKVGGGSQARTKQSGLCVVGARWCVPC